MVKLFSLLLFISIGLAFSGCNASQPVSISIVSDTISGSIDPSVKLSPISITIKNIKDNEPVTCHLEITNTDDYIKIVSISVKDPDILSSGFIKLHQGDVKFQTYSFAVSPSGTDSVDFEVMLSKDDKGSKFESWIVLSSNSSSYLKQELCCKLFIER